MGETTAVTESNNGETASTPVEPLNMIRKGAVAAVGGTMTAVGLVMIPLPTPFGAVIASSGLAVLGTEFDEAKELNDRLIEGAKGHLNNAREALVNGIESMDQDVCNANDRGSSTSHLLTDSSEKEVGGEANAVVKVTASASFGNDGCDDDGSGSNKNSPMWLHMNASERDRQERLAKEKYRRECQTSYEQTREYITKKTGRFLSRNVLPLIKNKDEQTTGVASILANCEKNDCDAIIKQEGIYQSKTTTKIEKEANTNLTSEDDEEEYVIIRGEDTAFAKENPRCSFS